MNQNHDYLGSAYVRIGGDERRRPAKKTVRPSGKLTSSTLMGVDGSSIKVCNKPRSCLLRYLVVRMTA
jgi:hypothetical protein